MHTEEFLKKEGVLFDVRSPSEFLKGHIPGAISFPLFSNEERAKVGTVYKQQGHDPAVLLGFELLGPKLALIAKEGRALAGPSKRVRLYCARGGLRSQTIAWILKTAGVECTLLSSGYKAFRNWSLKQFKIEYDLRILGGFSGSGKTETLYDLKEKGEQIVDLEKLANHRGSAFGHLGNSPQPSVEHFENKLAMELFSHDFTSPIWIEDESRMIGSCPIPKELFERMRKKPIYWIDCDREKRVERLFKEYGAFPKEELIDGVSRLVKKLGGARTEETILAIKEGKIRSFISFMLEYYDQRYSYALQKQERETLSFV